MKTIAGIFRSHQDAERAIQGLRAASISPDQLSLLTPGASAQELDTVPTTETEQPGMGKALGAVTGGATGFSGGVLGVAVTSLLLPGVGPVVAIGTAAGVLLGITGAVVGAAAGSALERALTTGLPQDELFVYEDALRQGRSVVIVLANDEAQAEIVRSVLANTGMESLNAAREQWWLGLRDAEEAAYEAPQDQFTQVEQTYRSGFEAALNPQGRGKSYDESKDFLREHYPATYQEEPFRHGYDRGQAYQQTLLELYRQEMTEEYRVHER